MTEYCSYCRLVVERADKTRRTAGLTVYHQHCKEEHDNRVQASFKQAQSELRVQVRRTA